MKQGLECMFLGSAEGGALEIWTGEKLIYSEEKKYRLFITYQSFIAFEI